MGRIGKTFGTFVVSWSIVLFVYVLRLTCRKTIANDPRPLLKANGIPYVYAAFHAHQVAALLCSEKGTGAMVSRSSDGQMIVPSLRSMGVKVVRGSGGKGGLAAIDRLVEHVSQGNPGYVAVDGPTGPRGSVHMGIAALAVRSGAVVIPIAPIPSRRWIVVKAWDRMQIPIPFCTIRGHCGKSLAIGPNESTESFRRRIEVSLIELEQANDPGEGKFVTGLRQSRKAA